MPATSNVLQVVINGKNNALPAFQSATKMMVRFGAVSTAALTAAAVRAGQFEKGMAEIATLLDGDVTPAIKDMREELLDMSVQFGQTIGKMTKARYDIISAGFTDAADSAIVLSQAGKLAIAGVTDVAKAADLLTSALGGLALGASESERVSDVLIQTMRKGKITVDEMSSGLGKLFSTAKTAGVELEELGAIIATATAAGVPAREMFTGLNSLMLAIAAPTVEAKDAMAAAGVTMAGGFTKALISVANAGGDSAAKLRELIPSIEALRVASAVAGNLGRMTDNLEAMANAAGVTEEAFQKMSETFDFISKQVRASIDAIVITVGSELLPQFKEMAQRTLLVAGTIRDMSDETKKSIREFAGFAVRILAVGVALKGIIITGAALGVLINGAVVTVGVLSSVVTLAATAISGLQVALVAVRGAFLLLMTGMSPQVALFVAMAVGVLSVVFAFKEATKGSDDLKKSMEDLGKEGEESASRFEKAWDDAKKPLLEIASSVAVIVAPSVAPVLQAMSTATKEQVKAAFIAEVKEAADGAKDSFDGMVTSMLASLGDVIPGLSDIIAALTGELNDLTKEAQNSGKAVAEAFDVDQFPKKKKVIPEVDEDLEALKEQIASLAEFTAEDFAQMAFTIGDSFAMVATDIGAHMLGLTKGPLMLGRAFKSMAAGVLSDIARIIARLLVAKALMAAFGGGGFFGKVFGQLGGASNAFGGTVPNAAFGMAIPGGGGSGMPAMVVPGAAGLDRSLVMGHGGEVMVPRVQVDAIDRARKVARTQPPPARRNRARRGDVGLTVQAVRPFRREEQNQLVDSVDEAQSRSSRHKG